VLVHRLQDAVNAQDRRDTFEFLCCDKATVSPMYGELSGRVTIRTVGRRSFPCFPIGWSRYEATITHTIPPLD